MKKRLVATLVALVVSLTPLSSTFAGPKDRGGDEGSRSFTSVIKRILKALDDLPIPPRP